MKKIVGPILVIAVTLAAAWLVYDKMVKSVPPDRSVAAARTTLEGLRMAGVKTAVARYEPMEHTVSLTGQVGLTEAGKADITAPLAGVIIQPLVKVGETVREGTPVAVINSVYGQTSLQVMQKIEQDQAALVSAQSALTQAQNGLGGANTALAQARTSESQAIDTLNEAKAEQVNATTDYHRKERLFKAGVSSQADVQDAKERYLKALSAVKGAEQVKKFAADGVRVAQENLPPSRENVDLARQAVTLAQANLDRDRAIYAQSAVSGASLPRNLTPVQLGDNGHWSAGAAASTSFYIRAPITGVVTSVAMSPNFAVGQGTIIASIANTGQVYVDANAFESDLKMIHEGDPVKVTSTAYPDVTFHGRVSYVGKAVDTNTHTVPVRTRIDNSRGILRPAMFVNVILVGGVKSSALVVPDHAVLVHGDKRYVFVEKSPGDYEKRAVEVGAISSGLAEIDKGLQPGEKVVTDGNVVLEGQE
jgi:cobalt-zinc-cadmium efflux system membrane fusion protein